MSSFEYIADYPLFYPAKQDADGVSLMAVKGMVVDWDQNPNAAVWVETDEAPTWGGPAPVRAPGPAPEVQEAPAPAAEPERPTPDAPESAPPAPEPLPEATPAAPVPAPELQVPTGPKPLFPGYAPPAEPYSR